VHEEVIAAELERVPGGRMLKVFRGISLTAQRIPKVRGLWQRAVMKSLYGMPGPDWPPLIKYHDDRWKFWR
jgi:hypothetical protein